MQIPILIDPLLGTGGFQAKAGEPFGLTAEGTTAEEAGRLLEVALRERLHAGSRLALIDLGNNSAARLDLNPIPEDDWFFPAMNEAIAENRRRENEAGERVFSSLVRPIGRTWFPPSPAVSPRLAKPAGAVPSWLGRATLTASDSKHSNGP